MPWDSLSKRIVAEKGVDGLQRLQAKNGREIFTESK